MTFPEDLRARLREIFAEELVDHVASMAERLVELENLNGSGPDEHLLREFFRSAHSLKGAAMAAGYPALESLCHALENALAPLVQNPATPPAAVLDALCQGVDALAAAVAPIRAGQPLDDGALEMIGRRITEAARGLPPPGRPGEPARPEAVITHPPPGSVPAGTVLRLPAGQLDGLLDQAGEVLIATRAAGLALEDVDRRLEELAARYRSWSRQRRELESGLRAGRPDAGPAALEEAERAWACAVETLGSVAESMRSRQRTLHRAAVTFEGQAERAGMIPFEAACQGLDAVVRDIARATGKRARLVINGRDVRVDRTIVSALREPLIHLVRNGVDHGLERPETRAQAGKPPQGTLSVSAEVDGGRVRVVVADDGAGIDEAQLRTAAAELGLAPEDDLHTLLFSPGVSTAGAVTLVSGRGVGLDIVRSQVEALGGSVEITSIPRSGTRVTLTAPATVATLRILVVEADGQAVALPLSAARHVIPLEGADLRIMEHGLAMVLDDRAVPVIDLALTLPGQPAPTAGGLAVIIEAGGEWAALLVEAVVAEEEIVLRPPGPRLAGSPLLFGAAVLPSGAAIAVLNPSGCTRHARGQARVAFKSPEAVPGRPRRLLVTEDSATTRALERAILEAAGYEVVTAADGAEAWRLLQETDVDLLLADVTMPNMDGLELCRRVRASTRLGRLPVILVTHLDRDEDRARGAEAGADAYLVKSTFDQGALLDAIARLL